MFFLAFLLLAVAGFIHGRFGGSRTRYEKVELVLVYLVAGYCGVIMAGISLWGIFDPNLAGRWMSSEHPANIPVMESLQGQELFLRFFLIAYLGMSVMATLSIWIRGNYITACVVAWSIFWFGGAWVHMTDYQVSGQLTFAMGVQIAFLQGSVGLGKIALLILRHRFDTSRKLTTG